MMKEIFIDVVLKHTSDAAVAEMQWNELETAYSSADRYFHTPEHLEHLYRELLPLQSKIDDWDSLLFALFFS